MAKITLGVTGSIAVQKIPDLIKRLHDFGHEVFVIMTKHAQVFGYTEEIKQLVGAQHFFSDEIVDDSNEKITHIFLAQDVDLLVIAPATYNSINKYANGIADDLLSTIVAAKAVPLLIFPAMNTKMYTQPIVQKNITYLRELGVKIIEPAYGKLACGVEGIGRLPQPACIVDEIQAELQPKKLPLQGKKILITAGPTRVYIDPIRYISNTSTGKMGYALATAAQKLGAHVVLIVGPNTLSIDSQIKTIPIETPKELKAAIATHFDDADYVFMSAAVSDYQPVTQATKKIKKQDDDITLALTRSEDILKTLGQQKQKQVLIGFAAEDENHLENGLKKLQNKNLDYIIINDLKNFASDENQVLILAKNQQQLRLANDSKTVIAEKIISFITTNNNDNTV